MAKKTSLCWECEKANPLKCDFMFYIEAETAEKWLIKNYITFEKKNRSYGDCDKKYYVYVIKNCPYYLSYYQKKKVC